MFLLVKCLKKFVIITQIGTTGSHQPKSDIIPNNHKTCGIIPNNLILSILPRYYLQIEAVRRSKTLGKIFRMFPACDRREHVGNIDGNILNDVTMLPALMSRKNLTYFLDINKLLSLLISVNAHSVTEGGREAAKYPKYATIDY